MKAVHRAMRERALAGLALFVLIGAWDAALRLDERVSPPRVRMTHAFADERESEPLAAVPNSIRDCELDESLRPTIQVFSAGKSCDRS